MPNNKVLAASIIALVIVFTMLGYAVGQRTTCFNFLGLAHGCVVDTTKR